MISLRNLREIAFRLTMISANECDSGTNYLRKPRYRCNGSHNWDDTTQDSYYVIIADTSLTISLAYPSRGWISRSRTFRSYWPRVPYVQNDLSKRICVEIARRERTVRQRGVARLLTGSLDQSRENPLEHPPQTLFCSSHKREPHTDSSWVVKMWLE
jgi:hypothetical protein